MPQRPRFTGSIWFTTLVALLVALGSQILVENLAPVAAFDWLHQATPKSEAVVRIAGMSFWREDTIIRLVAFSLGTFIAFLLAHTHSLRLLLALLFVAITATAFAQFPRPASTLQLAVWALSAPTGVLVVGLLFRAAKARPNSL
jgi:hypothetical protein